MLRSLISVAASWALVGCAMSIDQVRSTSDAEWETKVRNGHFDNGCPLDPVGREFAKTELFCELVHADRRSLVEEAIRISPQLLTCMPLLGCAPSKDAYQHWKKMGAPLQLSGLLRNGSDIFGLPGQSLQVAAGNAKPEVVALHLQDGASAKQRSGYASSPLGEALQVWHAHMTLPEQDGYLPGIAHFNQIEPNSSVGTVKVNRKDAAPTLEIVRMLIESGANMDDLIDSSAMAELGIGYEGWYTRYIDHRKRYSPLRPELAAAVDQAFEVRHALRRCREQGIRSGCEMVLAMATPLSPLRAQAHQLIAQIDREQSEWNKRIAAQFCRVDQDNWLYEGRSCANGWAQGKGRVQSRDRSTVYDGQFAKGQPISGRLTIKGSPHFEGGFSNWTPEGPGICWHDGQPEECRMLNGKRVDALHKQREENARQQQLAREREQREEEARLERRAEEARRRREAEAEERRDRRNQRALAAGIAAMSGNYAVAGAAGNSLASSLNMAQQQSQIMAQGTADIKRAQAQKEQEKREQAQREAALQQSERRARQQAQQVSSSPQGQVTQNLAAARQQQSDATAQRVREEEIRRQQEAQAATARRESERLQRERERQAEQQNRASLKAEYLQAVKDGTRMKVISCAGEHHVSGQRPRVKEPAGVSSCVDVAATAWCPGDRSGRSVLAKNFVGMGGCFGDTYKIDPQPSCKAEEMRVVVESVQPCP